MSDEITYHDYLTKENYYEGRSISKGRKAKTCEHCGGSIPIGQAHTMHHFYPEFDAYPTHDRCNEAFIASLRPDEPEAHGYDPRIVLEDEKVKVNECLENDDLSSQMLTIMTSPSGITIAMDYLFRHHGLREAVAMDYLYAFCKIHDISIFDI